METWLTLNSAFSGLGVLSDGWDFKGVHHHNQRESILELALSDIHMNIDIIRC